MSSLNDDAGNPIECQQEAVKPRDKTVSLAHVSRSIGGLDRFLAAQEAKVLKIGSPYATALAELESGKKLSHWIWYVFPQLLDPGRSSANNTRFQIASKSEAIGYLRHSILGPRYMSCLSAVLRNMEAMKRKKCALIHLMSGLVDAKKFYHSVSTFALASLDASLHTSNEEWANILAAALVAVCGDLIGNDICTMMDISPSAAQFAQALKTQLRGKEEEGKANGEGTIPPPSEVIPILANEMIKGAWKNLQV